jgi:NAD(P)-dependent dehydrogenase (short-subunit alcohol dehydrogenase family)
MQADIPSVTNQQIFTHRVMRPAKLDGQSVKGYSMDLQLQGKRALVTGASSGIGEAIARALASEGVDVVVHGRDRLRTSAVVDTIRASGSEASACVGDLSTEEGCKDVSNAARDLGAIDILINNAGIYAPHSWDSATSDAWLSNSAVE